MSNTLEFILALKDKFSAVAEKFTSSMEAASAVTNKVKADGSKVTSAATAGWTKVTTKIKFAVASSRQLESSLEGLRNKLTFVQGSMAKTTDKNAFRFYYEEAKKLERQIRRLEQGISGSGPLSKIKGWGKDFMSAMPGGAILTNPITALAAGVVKLTGFLKESKQAYIEEAEQITKLKQVMSNTMGARNQEVTSIQNLMRAQEDLGVIGVSVQSAGSQELATYLTKTESLKSLIPVMNDMLGQQYGMNATQEQAINIASMMGKVMDGQVGALSRYGYKFDEAQEKILKYGTEAQRVATLADVISDSVGGVNEALANTPEGKLKKAADKFDMIKGRVGELITKLQTSFSGSLEKVTGLIDKIVSKIEQHQDKLQIIAQIISAVLGKAMTGLEWVVSKVFGVISGLWTKLREGNPVVITLAVVLGSLIAALIVYQTYIGLVTLATNAWAAAQAILQAILAINPVTLIIAAIIALIAVIAYVIYKTEGWGKAWEHTVNGAKKLWETYANYVKAQFTLVVEGIMIGIDKIKLGWYQFKNAVGIGDSAENQSMIAMMNESIEKRKEAIVNAGLEVAKSAGEAWDEFKKAGNSLSWNSEKGFSDIFSGIKSKLGITAPTGIPGAETNLDEDKTKKDKKSAQKTNTAIATGGTKHNYITITLKQLVENINISGKDFRETTNQMEEQVLDALLRLTASATTAGG